MRIKLLSIAALMTFGSMAHAQTVDVSNEALTVPSNSTLEAAAQSGLYVHGQKIDALLLSEIEKQQIVGLAAIVIEEGEVAWSKAYGFADRERRVSVDLDRSQFRWASVSKPVTAIAAMQLVEKGLLDLDADIREYVPEFPDKGAKITARQLLCHQGGIVHYSNGPVVETIVDYDRPHPFENVILALNKFKDSPLVHPPGETYDYTTHGYILLSAVVERAGNQRFIDQVQERIAKPLGMKSFQPDYSWKDIPERTAGYHRSEDAVLRRPDTEVADVSWKLGGGGFTSTPADMATFCKGLLQTKLVSKATEEQMWTVAIPAKLGKAKLKYGLGFFVVDSPSGERWVGHDGSQTKTRTAILTVPDRELGIVILTNSEWVDPMTLAANLIEIID